MKFKVQKYFSSFSKIFLYFSLGISAFSILYKTNSTILGFYFTLLSIQILPSFLDLGIKSTVHSLPKSNNKKEVLIHLIKWFIRINFTIFIVLLIFNQKFVDIIFIPEDILFQDISSNFLIKLSLFTSIIRSSAELFSQYFYSKRSLFINAAVDTITSLFILIIAILFLLKNNLSLTISLLLISSSIIPLILYLAILLIKSGGIKKFKITYEVIQIKNVVLNLKSNYLPYRKLNLQFFILQLSTTVLTNLSPLLISLFADYSTTGSYRLFQLLFNALNAALLGYYIHLWIDSTNFRELRPIEQAIKKLSRLNFITVTISILFGFLIFKIFPNQIGLNLNYIFLYSIISSLTFIFGSKQTLYSLFLNGVGYPIYTFFAASISAIAFILSSIIIRNLNLLELVPISFLIANVIGFITIKHYAKKAYKKIKN